MYSKKEQWTIRDSYKEYSEEIEDSIDRQLYMNILRDFFLELCKIIIQERYDFKLPYRLGYLNIRKTKKKTSTKNKMPIDYKYYNETGKIKYLFNNHTEGYYFFWNWDRLKFKWCFFADSVYYRFIPCRGNDQVNGTRGLAAWIKACAADPTKKDYDTLDAKY